MSKTRYSFDLNPEGEKLIKDIRTKSNAASFAELFRKAMMFYDLLLDHQAKGGKVIFQHPDKSQETIRIL